MVTHISGNNAVTYSVNKIKLYDSENFLTNNIDVINNASKGNSSILTGNSTGSFNIPFESNANCLLFKIIFKPSSSTNTLILYRNASDSSSTINKQNLSINTIYCLAYAANNDGCFSYLYNYSTKTLDKELIIGGKSSVSKFEITARNLEIFDIYIDNSELLTTKIINDTLTSSFQIAKENNDICIRGWNINQNSSDDKINIYYESSDIPYIAYSELNTQGKLNFPKKEITVTIPKYSTNDLSVREYFARNGQCGNFYYVKNIGVFMAGISEGTKQFYIKTTESPSGTMEITYEDISACGFADYIIANGCGSNTLTEVINTLNIQVVNRITTANNIAPVFFRMPLIVKRDTKNNLSLEFDCVGLFINKIDNCIKKVV